MRAGACTIKKRMLAGVLALLLCCAAAPASAQNAARNVWTREGVLAYLPDTDAGGQLSRWTQNTLPGLVGASGEWYFLALRQYDPTLPFSAYAKALTDYAQTQTAASAVTRQKLALALLACGRGEDALVRDTMATTPGAQGVMSWIFALHLMNNGAQGGQMPPDEAARRLLALQRADGGWAVMGEGSDVDVTAMALQALAPRRDDQAVAAAVERALALLAARQMDDGGFASMGVPNAESTAQAIVALCALGIDPASDARFLRPGGSAEDALAAYRLANGRFSHTAGGAENEMATVQALCARVALERLRDGRGSLYLFEPLPARTALSWRGVAVISICALGAAVMLALWGTKKRRASNFVLVALACGALSLAALNVRVALPGAYYGSATPKQATGEATLSIRCDTVAGRDGWPADGVLLPETALPLADGETVYDLLLQAARQYGLLLDCRGTAGGGRLAYVAGISQLSEFDYGDLSGWMYQVNGEAPGVGCGEYALSDGDSVVWRYTTALGRDLE